MANITLSIPEDLLQQGRQYAAAHHTSLNNLVRDQLAKLVQKKSKTWLKECFALMDQAKVNSKGKKTWKREDLYDV